MDSMSDGYSVLSIVFRCMKICPNVSNPSERGSGARPGRKADGQFYRLLSFCNRI